MSEKIKPKDKPHYVNNAEFSQAVVDYVSKRKQAVENGEPVPQVTDYIARCFLRICEGLSHKSNFVRYTYREEMVMDAVENCLKAIENYNLDVATRTKKPNAFAYFTQISWYAFLRRIEKEKKQQDIKVKFLSESTIGDLVCGDQDETEHNQAFVDDLKDRIDYIKSNDRLIKEYSERSVRKKRVRVADSDLSTFMEE